MDIPPSTPEPGSPLDAPAPQAAPAAVAELVPAGFWIRGGAYMIDGILITVGQLLLFGFLLLVGIPKVVANLGSSLLGIGYFIWMPVANSGQTVGKMAAGIAVMRTDNQPLTYLRCLGRWAGYILSSITLGLGFIAAAFTDQKRALHDYLADTRVVFIREIGTARKTFVILMAFVPVFVGIVAALAIPKFLQLAGAAGEGSAKAGLGSLRAAASVYYGENNGKYPAQLSDLTPKQLAQIPALKLKDHPQSSEVTNYEGAVCSGTAVDPTKARDTGRWGYVSDPAATCFGSIFVDCVHVDSKQKQWVSY
jgi:uncharacterized RDD family membrane protein YckC/type II secretory pathway pseudopilin PulG